MKQGKTITVTFNGNGGTVKTKSRTVACDRKYGNLDAPVRKGYIFKGWYTKKSGGTRITASAKVTSTKNVTLYAHWEKVTVKKPAFKSLTSKKAGALTVKMKKNDSAEGFQLLLAANSKFTKNKKR